MRVYFKIIIVFTLSAICLIQKVIAQNPGGVNGGTLKLWVKADAGLTLTNTPVTNTVSGWVNQADNTKNLVPSGTAPVATANTYINFNPIVQFGGAGTMYTNGIILPANSNYSRFAVFNASTPGSGFANVIGSGSPSPPTSGNVTFAVQSTPSVAALQWVGSQIGNTAAYAFGIPQIGTSVYSSGTASGTYIKINGTANTATAVTVSYPASNIQLGAVYNLGGGVNVNFLTGSITEAIVYNTALTATQVTQVESYLALKYGKTIAGNYLASDGTNVWNATTNSGYTNNVAGIGRDNVQGALDQKQSQSINTGNQVIMSLGSIATNNASNSATFASDKEFLVWGDNATAGTTAFSSAPFTTRLNRVWKVQKTGTFTENVQLLIPRAFAGAGFNVNLVYNSTSSTFASGNQFLASSGNVTVNNVSYYSFILPGSYLNTQSSFYFTLASYVEAPGGVTTGLTRWLRGDKGVTAGINGVSQWDDQALGFDATQTVAARMPAYITAGSKLNNFNPTLSFLNPSLATDQDRMSMPDNGLAFGAAARSVFSVGATNNNASPTNVRAGGLLMLYGSGIANQLFGLSRNGPLAVGAVPAYGQIAGALGNCCAKIASTAPVYDTYLPINAYGGYDGTNLKLSKNGSAITTSAVGLTTSSTGTSDIGGSVASTTWDGEIPEIIFYNSDLTAAEKQRVDSYLDLKYGITQSSSYVASDGTTITWNIAANPSFNNNIAGIGKDITSALDQKQSMSENGGNQLIMSLATLDSNTLANTGTFAADKQFLIWGDNALAGTASFIAAPYTNRINRVWMVKNTGGINQNIQVLLPKALLGASQVPGLLYNSTSATFASGNSIYPNLGSYNVAGTDYYSFSLPATQVNQGTFYLSLAYYVQAPGGILGQAIWLKADAQSYTDGASLDNTNRWIATTGNDPGLYATNFSGGGASPIFKSNTWNYNPVIRFNKGALGSDFTPVNSFVANTSFTTINFTGASGQQGAPTPGEVRSFSISGGSNLDGAASSQVPVMGAAPLRVYENGASSNFNNNVTGGTGPGVAMAMQTSSGPVSGNAASTLYAQWNGGTEAKLAGINRLFTMDYYVLGGAAIGSKATATDSSFLTGDIPEVILYDKELQTHERQRVNTYLAIKYGVTMDQLVAGQDYLSSNRKIIWSGNANLTYKYNITGIGVDSISGLNQKQSQNISNTNEPVIALGNLAASNSANTNAFTADSSFAIWGNNNGAVAFSIYTPVGMINMRMARTWLMQETRSVGAVQVALPATSVVGGLTNISLLVSNVATFAPGSVTSLPMTLQTINGIQYYTTNVDFTSNAKQYFSFGAYQTPDNILINPTRGSRLRTQ